MRRFKQGFVLLASLFLGEHFTHTMLGQNFLDQLSKEIRREVQNSGDSQAIREFNQMGRALDRVNGGQQSFQPLNPNNASRTNPNPGNWPPQANPGNGIPNGGNPNHPNSYNGRPFGSDPYNTNPNPNGSFPANSPYGSNERYRTGSNRGVVPPNYPGVTLPANPLPNSGPNSAMNQPSLPLVSNQALLTPVVKITEPQKQQSALALQRQLLADVEQFESLFPSLLSDSRAADVWREWKASSLTGGFEPAAAERTESVLFALITAEQRESLTAKWTLLVGKTKILKQLQTAVTGNGSAAAWRLDSVWVILVPKMPVNAVIDLGNGTFMRGTSEHATLTMEQWPAAKLFGLAIFEPSQANESTLPISPREVLLVNSTTVPFSYVINQRAFTLQPGFEQSLDGRQSWSIRYDQGNGQGTHSDVLTEGIYEPSAQEGFWQLKRLQAAIEIDNSQSEQAFHYVIDGKPYAIPPHAKMQHQSPARMRLQFDDGQSRRQEKILRHGKWAVGMAIGQSGIGLYRQRDEAPNTPPNAVLGTTSTSDGNLLGP